MAVKNLTNDIRLCVALKQGDEAYPRPTSDS